MWKGLNLIAMNLVCTRFSRYISMRSLNFFFPTNSSLFNLAISSLDSLSCWISLLKVVFSGWVVISITSMCFSIASTLPLPFFLTGAYIMSSFSTLSFFVDDLVKGLLALVSTAIDGDGKSNILPIVPV
jgi:hypothetical protein